METALVLGGGGIAGIAWEVGVLVGLRRAGVDLTGADLVVGTSAGSVVGALVATGVDLEQAVADRRFTDLDAFTAPVPNADPRANRVDFGVLARVFGALADTSLPAAERLRRVGTLAVEAPTRDEADHLSYFRQRIPHDTWPAGRALVVTAVDTATGEFVAWDRDSGVSLVTAVAASCAVPGVYPPVTVAGRRFMDGGMRSGTNADLAAGARRIVVIAPMAGISALGAPPRELEELRRDAEVLLVAPDEATTAAFGPNLLDVAAAAPSLVAGLAQGAALADRVRPLS